MSEEPQKWEEIAVPLTRELNALNGEFRASIIVLQSYIDYMIDKIIETLIESQKLSARRINFERKIDLLKDLGYIKNETFYDLKALYDIRAICAHDLDVYSEMTREKIREKFQQLKIIERGKNEFFPEIDVMQTNLSKLAQFLLRMLHTRYTLAFKNKQDKSIKINLDGEYDLNFYRVTAKDIIDSFKK